MYVLILLIGILSFWYKHHIQILGFKLTITYIYTAQLVSFIYTQHTINRQ